MNPPYMALQLVALNVSPFQYKCVKVAFVLIILSILTGSQTGNNLSVADRIVNKNAPGAAV